MSRFAYYRHLTNNTLNIEEKEHKDEIIKLTVEKLDARGIEFDSRISRLDLNELKEILEVRRRYKKKNKRAITEKASSYDNTDEATERNPTYKLGVIH
jgi:hypothetical protein